MYLKNSVNYFVLNYYQKYRIKPNFKCIIHFYYPQQFGLPEPRDVIRKVN